jgi:hypothetical protein
MVQPSLGNPWLISLRRIIRNAKRSQLKRVTTLMICFYHLILKLLVRNWTRTHLPELKRAQMMGASAKVSIPIAISTITTIVNHASPREL